MQTDLTRRSYGRLPILILLMTLVILIIGYILYITFYDVQDLPWKRQKEKPPEMKFEQKQQSAPMPQTPASAEK